MFYYEKEKKSSHEVNRFQWGTLHCIYSAGVLRLDVSVVLDTYIHLHVHHLYFGCSIFMGKKCNSSK